MANRLAHSSSNKTIGMKILGHKTGRIFDHYASHMDKETFSQMTEAMKKALIPEAPNEPIPFNNGAVPN